MCKVMDPSIGNKQRNKETIKLFLIHSHWKVPKLMLLTELLLGTAEAPLDTI